MNGLDLFVSTAVSTASPSFMSVERQPKISSGEAEQLIEKQRELVAAGARANMSQVGVRAVGDNHFKSVQRNSRAIGYLVDAVFLQQRPNELLETPLQHYGQHAELDSRDMLHAERLWPTGFGTCFLTDDEVVVTAAHIFCNDSGANDALRKGRLRVVFGYEVAPGGQTANVFREHRQVFAVKPREVICSPGEGIPVGDDWIKLKLVEPATRGGSRTPLVVSVDPPAINTPVYSLGHPNGVSLRYAHTSVPLERHAHGFSAFLDAYNKSSGSPVFSAGDHRVVGLVKFSSQRGGRYQVRGELRYVSQLCLPGYANKATLCVDSAAFGHE